MQQLSVCCILYFKLKIAQRQTTTAAVKTQVFRTIAHLVAMEIKNVQFAQRFQVLNALYPARIKKKHKYRLVTTKTTEYENGQ